MGLTLSPQFCGNLLCRNRKLIQSTYVFQLWRVLDQPLLSVCIGLGIILDIFPYYLIFYIEFRAMLWGQYYSLHLTDEGTETQILRDFLNISLTIRDEMEFTPVCPDLHPCLFIFHFVFLNAMISVIYLHRTMMNICSVTINSYV